MKPKTMTYQRVRNLGNYESERLEITAEVEDNENYLEVAQHLRAEVTNLLYPPKPPPPAPEANNPIF